MTVGGRSEDGERQNPESEHEHAGRGHGLEGRGVNADGHRRQRRKTLGRDLHGVKHKPQNELAEILDQGSKRALLHLGPFRDARETTLASLAQYRTPQQVGRQSVQRRGKNGKVNGDSDRHEALATRTTRPA
jgi:hypothetical protein